MKKQIKLLPILLAFVLLFPIDMSASSYFSDEMMSFGRDAAQESVQAEDGFVLRLPSAYRGRVGICRPRRHYNAFSFWRLCS